MNDPAGGRVGAETMEPGQRLPTRTYQVTRADLVRYAGASGDFNPIHWSERTARAVGLPGVIAHGMLTMALAGRAVISWVGAPDAMVDFSVRFTRPVPVPDDEAGTQLEVSAVVRSVTVPPAGGLTTAELELTVTCEGRKVLNLARALVRI